MIKIYLIDMCTQTSKKNWNTCHKYRRKRRKLYTNL